MLKKMKKIFPVLLALSVLFIYCGDKEEEAETTEGHEQVETPVMNSGAETERDRALQSIERDTTNKEISIGKDSSEPRD